MSDFAIMYSGYSSSCVSRSIVNADNQHELRCNAQANHGQSTLTTGGWRVFRLERAQTMRANSTVVLLIEDNPGDQRLISEALTAAGVNCELRVISNGAQALESAREIGTEESAGVPAVIILDLHLPCVDGTEILTALRKNPACDRAPIITVSSLLTPAEGAFLNSFLNVIHVHKSSELDQFFAIGRIVAELLAQRRSYDATSIEKINSSSSA